MKHEESLMQMEVLRWFKLQYPHLARLLIGYPAGINLGVTARMRMKAMGLTAGVPDLQLLLPRIYPLKLLAESGMYFINEKRFCPGLFIELKTEDGKLSQIQKEYHEILRSQRYTIVTCYSFEEAVVEIKKYLDGYNPSEMEIAHAYR